MLPHTRHSDHLRVLYQLLEQDPERPAVALFRYLAALYPDIDRDQAIRMIATLVRYVSVAIARVLAAGVDAEMSLSV